ncbi:MAG: flap endonuclease, partial [Solirubrobacterales bacterium]|nr:flap endonuclease [Solirubrobacterales bacterium]
MACDWMMIDGPSLIFRAYYGARATDRDGAANAIRGFLDRLAGVIAQRRPRRVVVAEDRAWRPAWRVELISSYKSHRAAEPVPPALAPQIPVTREILAAVGIDVVGIAEHEAEDVIATLTNQASGSVEILSGDRDLFALVDGARVRVLYPEKGGYAVIDEDEVSRRYGVPGRRYADFAILRGDPSDGLPGLKGVGSVAAAAMIRRHGSIEGVLRDRRLRDPDRDYLGRAIRVVKPVIDLPIVLPAGRRDHYPAQEALLGPLLAKHGAAESGARLL